MVGLWAIERVYISLYLFLYPDVLIRFDQSEVRFHQLPLGWFTAGIGILNPFFVLTRRLVVEIYC
jgi:hypothetical protein